MRIEFLPGAQSELNESAVWYANRSERVATRFLASIEATIETIANRPERFAHVDERHQGCRVPRFPFRVIFRHLRDRVLIVAISHLKREPNHWHPRITLEGQEPSLPLRRGEVSS